MEKTPLIGAHVSIADDIALSVLRAVKIGASSMQIFTKSNRSWFAKKLTAGDIERFKDALKEHNINEPVVHASYLINLASNKADTEQNSIKALIDELQRCQQLGIPHLVLHPGSHLGAGIDAGITKIAHHLNKVLEQANGTTTIALELMAGQGTNLGSTFEQLNAMIEQCDYKEYLGICLDTCHAFAAGYQLKTEDDYKALIKNIDDTVGLKRLRVIHLNDSQESCGAKKDRHASLGQGKIPMSIFKHIMHDTRLAHIPKILETPDPDLYAQEIELLKSFV